MKKLLTDIELDFCELKCLLEYLEKNKEDKQLYQVAHRSLVQLTERVSQLSEEFTQYYKEPTSSNVSLVEESGGCEDINVCPTVEDNENLVEKLSKEPQVEPAVSSDTSSELYRSLSLNDVFRYSRELFGNETSRLKLAVNEMENLGSYESAIGYLVTQIDCSLDNPAYQDMDEFLKAYFKR